MNNWQALLVCLALFGLLLSHKTEPQKSTPPAAVTQQIVTSEAAQPEPPTPPLIENFDGEPQLSLFPRIATFRPEDDDREKLPFWSNYRKHLLKTSGVTGTEGPDANRQFAFKSIRGIDSVSFFSPIRVTPNTRYQVSLNIRADLPEGASAGAGIIEFDQFLWQAEQYPQSVDQQHRTGAKEGFRITENRMWNQYKFRFTTGPNSHMIHLILFREGTASRAPVMIDDISIINLDRP